jgi:hypothetical protein
MQDVAAGRKGTVDAFPREAMGAHLTAGIVADHAVAVMVTRAEPRPARVGLAGSIEVEKTFRQGAPA